MCGNLNLYYTDLMVDTAVYRSNDTVVYNGMLSCDYYNDMSLLAFHVQSLSIESKLMYNVHAEKLDPAVL